MRTSWQHLLLAFVLAAVAWYFVSGREMVESEIEVRLQRAGMSQDLVIRAPGLPNSVMVQVRGPKGLLRSLDARSLAYDLDLSRLKVGTNVITIDEDEMPFPYTFQVMQIDPQLIQVEVDELAQRLLPVEVSWNGTIAEDYWLESASADPAVVQVRGPKSVVDAMNSVPTRLLQVDNATSDVSQEVTLEPVPEVEISPGAVTVTLDVAVETKEWSPMVPVDVVNLSGYEVTAVRPDKVRMHLSLPVTLARQDNVSELIRARVEVGEALAPGVHALELVADLPAGAELITFEPMDVQVTLGPERTVVRTFNVPVTMDNESGRSVLSVTPDTVEVQVQLPASQAGNGVAPMVEARAVVDPGASPGLHQLPLMGMAPPGAEVLSLDPDSVEVLLGD